MKKIIIIGIFFLAVILSFQGVIADSTGTCGTNVKYTISGNVIKFSKEKKDLNAVWDNRCSSAIKDNIDLAEVKVIDSIVLTEKTYRPFAGLNTYKMDLSKLDVSSIKNMDYMFSESHSLKSINLDGWDFSNVTTMFSMFFECNRLETLDVSNWNVSNVTDMSWLFYNCFSLTFLDVSNWDTSNTRSMHGMFEGCGKLSSLDVSNWDTSNVEHMSYMFSSCGKLSSLDVSSWNTSKVVDMAWMFYDCRLLSNLDVVSWNVSKVKNMDSMFRSCTSLLGINVSKWDTSNVTSMESMFKNCSNLVAIDTSVWNTANVTIMDSMFESCKQLYSLNLAGWDTSKVSDFSDMFTDSSLLATLTFGKNTINSNIFESLSWYRHPWYYIEPGLEAKNPSSIGTKLPYYYLFEKYIYNNYAGTWSAHFSNVNLKIIVKDYNNIVLNNKDVLYNIPSFQLKASSEPNNSLEIYWESSDSSIAIVSSNGKVTFKKPGTVTIFVRGFAKNLSSPDNTWINITYKPLVATISLLNGNNDNITGKKIFIGSKQYRLKAISSPNGASHLFSWKSDDTGIATVNSNGKVTFKKAGLVLITATASDGSNISGSVTLKYVQKKPDLEIRDTNIRGKNKEIQVTIPWSDELIKTECSLYDESTGKEIKPVFVERMDSTGKNKVVSWVGAPLVNGNIYRFKIRVSNGVWSNYVEKYAMPISNVYGATVVAGNKTMYINTQHREPATGTRYMVFDAATQKELAYKLGSRVDTTWKYDKLTNGKLYYVVAVPYRDYKGQRLWGPNQNRIYFIPMGVPSQGKVSFSGSNATVSIASDSSVDGIRVLYRPAGGALKNGCEAKGASCTIKGLKNSSAYEFYAMKYKVAESKTYYSMGTLIPYKTTSSGLSAPQMNPVVAMNNSGYTTFTIRKSSNAEGISVLYKIGTGNFVQACEKAGNSCSTTLDISKNYTFFIMQYKTVNGKKVYSPGIVARDFTSGKAPNEERLYTGFTLADGIIDMNEIYDALDGYMSEESLLLAEAFAVMGEDMVSKGVEEFYEEDDFDYSGFDDDAPYGEYEDDASGDGYEPEELYDEGIDTEYGPEAGWEEPFDEGDEPQEESEELYMYYFGNGEKPLPPAPSFGNL